MSPSIWATGVCGDLGTAFAAATLRSAVLVAEGPSSSLSLHPWLPAGLVPPLLLPGIPSLTPVPAVVAGCSHVLDRAGEAVVPRVTEPGLS